MPTPTATRRDALMLFAGGAASAFAGRAFAAPTSAPPPDKELMVPVQGGRIYVRVNGRIDGPRAPVIMAHGGPGGNHANFLPGLALAGERAVILYDQLDSGKSDVPNDPANWTVPRFVSEIDAIRAALGLERVHLLGASWGGTVAAEYAIGRPKGLNSVILESPLISTAVWIADTGRQRASLPLPVRQELDRCEGAQVASGDKACEAATRAFYKSFTSLELEPAYVRDYEKTLPKPFNADLYNYMWGPSEFASSGTLKTYDAEPRLSRIRTPALYLVGQHDTCTPAAARRFARRTPGAEVKVIARAAHAIPTDQSDAWLSAVSGWLRRFD
jgi:proline iminopeptidase